MTNYLLLLFILLWDGEATAHVGGIPFFLFIIPYENNDNYFLLVVGFERERGNSSALQAGHVSKISQIV